MAEFIFLNPNLAREVVGSAWASAECDTLADKGVEIAKSIAPVGSPAEPDEHAGRYRDSIHAEHGDKGAKIVADALDSSGRSYAVYVEFGSIHNPAFHVLADTAVMLGGNTRLGVQHRRTPGRRR